VAKKGATGGGFFFDTAPKRVDRPRDEVAALGLLHERQCEACPLWQTAAKTKGMPPTGADRPLLYVLGEAPGREEDAVGRQFVGEAGKTLRRCLPKTGIPIRWNNVVRTRPPNNRTPEWIEIECCRPSVAADIARSKPAGILAVGGVATNWLIGQSTINRCRGRRYAVKINGHVCWAFPVFHASYINRLLDRESGGDPLKTDQGLVFRRDIANALSYLQDDPTPHDGLTSWG